MDCRCCHCRCSDWQTQFTPSLDLEIGSPARLRFATVNLGYYYPLCRSIYELLLNVLQINMNVPQVDQFGEVIQLQVHTQTLIRKMGRFFSDAGWILLNLRDNIENSHRVRKSLEISFANIVTLKTGS